MSEEYRATQYLQRSKAVRCLPLPRHRSRSIPETPDQEIPGPYDAEQMNISY